MAKKKIGLEDKDGHWHEATYYPDSREVYLKGSYVGRASTVDDAITVVRQILNKQVKRIEISDA
ncbi:MAG: hypothetical protein K6U75_02965 [Firmicutes bacterium]|nr:hypothetical protein [Bacillota bacterium]